MPPAARRPVYLCPCRRRNGSRAVSRLHGGGGEIVMYGVGVIWLAVDLHVGPGKAISLGLTPFLAGDAMKAAIAALLLPGAWKLVRRH
jgi:biotin transport system substrate-specific component